MSTFDNGYNRAAQAYDRQLPPDDDPGPLDDKPEGFCPWCDAELADVGCPMEYQACHSCDAFDSGESEDDNRARYAREREADDKIEVRIARETRKRGNHE